MSFNLLDRAWMSVVDVDGERFEVSGRDAVFQSHEFSGLALEFPTQEPALLRQFLLAIVYSALDLPRDKEEWAEIFQEGRFPNSALGKIEAYLDRWHDRFDLLHPEFPFGQVAGLTSASGEEKTTLSLVPTLAAGNNVPLFSPYTEKAGPSLGLAEAARWVMHVHCWDTAGIKTGMRDDPQVKAGKTTGNHTGTLGGLGVVVPVGRTLFETLMLNWLIQPDGRAELDKPQWETEHTAQWQSREPAGIIDLLTWQSRRMRLVTDDRNGETMVVGVHIGSGDRMTRLPEYEPHTAWNHDRKKGEQRPKRYQQGKRVWEGLEAILTVHDAQNGASTADTSELLNQIPELARFLPTNYPLAIHTSGISYGTQSAIVEDFLSDALPLPVAALGRDSDSYDLLVEIAGKAQKLAMEVNFLAGNLRKCSHGEPTPWDKGQRPGEQLIALLSKHVIEVLRRAQDAGADIEALRELRSYWDRKALADTFVIADGLLASTAPSAWQGRVIDGHTYTPALVEIWFRSKVKKIIPTEDSGE
jgi:CRISPR system Cascade subunit CasA